jgi:hypothetical protein
MTVSQMTPEIKKKLRPLHRLNAMLDEHVLPYPVRFLTNRVIILATLALLVPLLFFTSDQAFVNALNSYLNVMSVVVSSTVLLYATIADVRDRAAAKRADQIAKTYEQVLEKRVQADHELIQQILQNSIENILGGRLEKIRVEDHKKLEEMQKAVIASNEALRAELAEKALIASNESLRAELAALSELVQALYQSHLGESTASGS